MKQAYTYLPTYAADNSAMCSALYELGGLIVMHDASGCNSTYTTHDEPRWFDRPANVFISALTETDAVLGNEGRLIDDIKAAASELHPEFIALAGTPIPMMMGCDYDGIAREIETATGIVSFGVDTNGTDDYIAGIGKAFVKLAERFVAPSAKRLPRTLNILGVTPLDFSVNGTAESFDAFAEAAGWKVLSNWAMGENASLPLIRFAGLASVNWVVSAGGLPAALWLAEHFGTPFVVGAPYGRFMAELLPKKWTEAARENHHINLAVGCRGNFTSDNAPTKVAVIGEAVTSAAIRASLVKDEGLTDVAVLTPLTAPDILLGTGDRRRLTEDDFREILPDLDTIVADPFFAHFTRTLPGGATVKSVDLPHVALSGRIWEQNIPVLTGTAFNDWYRSRGNRRPLL